jgi:hypothetical protein
VVVDDLPTAAWIASTYLAADHASWADFREVGLYELCARALRRGLVLGAIGDADLWSTDVMVWAKLQAWDDQVLKQQLALISPATRFVWDDAAPTFCVSTKLRTVDPDVLVDGRPRRLSALDPDFARQRAAYLASKQGRWPMRVIPPA